MSYKGYIERLKANHPASDAWWDSPTTTYKTHKETLLIKYPSAHTYIDYLMPDDFSSTGYGLSSVTTNPRLVAKAILTDKDYWGSRFDASTSSCQLLLTQLSTAVVRDGAAMLSARWRKSAKTTGWISAQVDPINVQCIDRMSTQGQALQAVAENVMVKVPGNAEGLTVVERLVAQGCSVNVTFCFTVSQFQASITAIERGKANACQGGVPTGHCKYVITLMIGRITCQTELQLQAAERGIKLGIEDLRWAELMIYQRVQSLTMASPAKIETLLSSIKVDVDANGRKQCWHLEKTGQTTTLYTLTPEVVDFLIERESYGDPVAPSSDPIRPPVTTVNRLMQLPYFIEAYLPDAIDPFDFSNHEAFINTWSEASMAHRRLSDYCKMLCAAAGKPTQKPDSLLTDRIEETL
ncbi:transaldolase family protein [Pseudomonas syringae pv. actinidifoliorum]|nr:transaldolase family protein [Pseudomonas syringae pv. actinidifoliorum]MDU8520160.1 transaldolase family protein [Pseudomonas syringae pv. actinidifoliorum]MDU8527681.1 transaldolase family protein [Pseudomonas syringae pv. actinidifoliorum]